MLDYLNAIDLSFAWQLFERGGPVVVLIAAMSIAALAVTTLKLVQFLSLGVGHRRGVEAALRKWIGGRHDQAIAELEKQRGATARVLAHALRGIRRNINDDTVREDAERIGKTQLTNLRSHLRVIEATAQVTPLLGLFGTVIGMMSAFQALHSAGAEADPSALAGGIWIALITTAVGLAVAIPAGLALYWFEGRIERETANMEEVLASVFTNRLQVPHQASELAPSPQSHHHNIAVLANAAE
jgi:biopolymer transport protein ExbB